MENAKKIAKNNKN